MPPFDLWLLAFVGTVVLEAPIVVLATRRRLGAARSAVVAFALQALTHPALWYALPRFEPYALWLVWAEGCVTLVEGLALAVVLHSWGEPRRRALARGLSISLVANAFSTLIGLWVF